MEPWRRCCIYNTTAVLGGEVGSRPQGGRLSSASEVWSALSRFAAGETNAGRIKLKRLYPEAFEFSTEIWQPEGYGVPLRTGLEVFGREPGRRASK